MDKYVWWNSIDDAYFVRHMYCIKLYTIIFRMLYHPITQTRPQTRAQQTEKLGLRSREPC